MNTRTRATLLASLAAAMITLTGCTNDTSAVGHEVRRIPTPDGGTVLCVIVRDTGAGSTAVDCNWETRPTVAPTAANEDHAW